MVPTIVIASLLTVLAWPIPYRAATTSIDESWQIALHMAAARQFQHGVDIVFTYGPLGFLGFPVPFVGPSSAVALLASFAVYLALVATMFIEARRLVPAWAAALLTLIVARTFLLLPPFEALQALVILWSVEAILGRFPFRPSAIAVAAGALTGIAVLGKSNVGIVVAGIGLVTTLAVSPSLRRGVTTYAVTALAVAAGAWLLTGQRLLDVVAFADGMSEIVSGYNGAMGSDVMPKRAWIYLALVGAGIIVAWNAWRIAAQLPRRKAVAILGLMLVIGVAMWKTAIVREHGSFVLITLTVAMFALGSGLESRTWIAFVLGLGMATAGSTAIEPRTVLDVAGSVRSFAYETSDAFWPGRSEAASERTRAELRRRYRMDQSMLARLDGRTVHVDPALTSAAYAYDLEWAPVPIFQAYAAYTTALDERNAEVIRSGEAPARILRSFRPAALTDLLRTWIDRPLRADEVLPSMVDGRFRWFEQPATTLEIFCRYRELEASDRWQVLARTDRACAAPEALASIRARVGEEVRVPVESRPRRFVIVRVHGLEPRTLGRIRATVLKGYDWYVTLDDTRYRLIAATAEDGLLVSVPTDADGTGRFAFGPAIQTITITRDLDGHGSTAPLTFEFLSVPLDRAS
jgi:hypothetical protein